MRGHFGKKSKQFVDEEYFDDGLNGFHIKTELQDLFADICDKNFMDEYSDETIEKRRQYFSGNRVNLYFNDDELEYYIYRISKDYEDKTELILNKICNILEHLSNTFIKGVLCKGFT